MQRIVFRNATVFDGTELLGEADVVVEGERITELVCRPNTADLAPDDVTYDVAGMTLMPGMVAGHGHFALNDIDLRQPTGPDLMHTAAYMGVVAAKSAEKTLHAGFTSYIGAGTIHNIDVELKELISNGIVEGPRIVPCSRDFGPSGCAVDYKPDHWGFAPSMSSLGAICNGPDEFRREIRRDAKRGAKILKLYPEGGHGLPECTRMAPDEIATAVETALLCDMRVRCHVYSKPAIKACIDAGIGIIDHGDHIDDELSDMCVERGIYVLPSLYFATQGVGVYHTQDDVDRWFDKARESLAMGVKKGIKYVNGDDFGLAVLPHGDNAKELTLYVEEMGISALDVLKWATSNGAEMSGLPDIGKIAPGKFADMVVIDGDPIKDISVLSDRNNIGLVMKAGEIAKSTLSDNVG